MNSPYAVFFAMWYPKNSQLWSLSSRRFGNFFYVVIRCMLVVSKYLQSGIKSCKLDSRRRVHILCKSEGCLLHMSKNKKNDIMVVLVLSYILYLIFYLLNGPIV